MPAPRKAFLFVPFFSLLTLAFGPIVFAQNGQLQNGQGGQQQNAQAQAQNMAAPQEPFQLTPKHLEYLGQLLDYWEASSSKIERYKCDFSRYVYDEPFLNRRDAKTGHLFARTLATGQVRYAKPDKGMYESENVWQFEAPPENPGEEPKYKKIDEPEKWICDGQSVFEFKYGEQKLLIERPLPPDMRGQKIADGPLPFLFGAKKDEMMARYWIRVITPANAQGEYWLEAYPKRIDDARDMKKVEVILDEADFLPKAITIYETNHDPENGLTRKTTFEFTKREYNWAVLPEILQDWIGQFHRPRTPLGFKKVVQPFASAEAAGPQVQHSQQENGLRQANVQQNQQK